MICMIPKNSALQSAFPVELLKHLENYLFAMYELQVQVFAQSLL